ncbi:hypothetical protein RN001_012495 [Aquatica leii]|uniref:Lymphoid-specific helicase n=1 Tax=Aquatica leii TaxID=1421715 RepID=A0AAN7SMH0_9COLE|nr:hypothetical protein RN001_012495 [Aquatica leii]
MDCQEDYLNDAVRLDMSSDKSKKKIKLVNEMEHAEKSKIRLKKSIKYLLTQSLKFSNFFKQKLDEHLHFNESDLKDVSRHDETSFEGQEDFASLTKNLDVTKKLKYFEGGTLKPYQVEGLTWLIILFENGLSGILADEMGLGKTVQVIALICHLYERHLDGPYLIVAPLSTIPNWVSEFKRFSPKIPVILFHGNKEERHYLERQINSKHYLDGKLVKPVIITTFNIPLIAGKYLSTHVYQYLIVDEGHRLKNHLSKLSLELQKLKSSNRLLLTGTPLQNNMTELWSLLNFILPHLFTDLKSFSDFLLMDDIENNESESASLVSTLHQVLSPFMLRRLKTDVLIDLVPKKEVLVYCPLSNLQLSLYKYILEKNIRQLKDPNGVEEVDDEPKSKRRCNQMPKKYTEYDSEDSDFEAEADIDQFVPMTQETKKLVAPFVCRLTMQNPAIMFKKVVNHPYLVHFPLDPNSPVKKLLVDEQLINQSGKMLVLEAMLAKLHAGGHKVLLFSTLVMTIHLIEEFLIMRNYEYRQLDGSLRLESRRAAIEEFNNDPNVFIFLCSTRAGGLGVNLTAADTVIFFDRDWNPQVDIQAQDRCHRIGQTKPVMIYTLIAKNTIDERILHCGNVKRKLEKVVIKDGQFKDVVKRTKLLDFDFEELKKILESSDNIHTIHTNGFVLTDEELNVLMDRSELYKQMKK